MLEKSSNFKTSDLGFLFRRFFFSVGEYFVDIHSFFFFLLTAIRNTSSDSCLLGGCSYYKITTLSSLACGEIS